MRRRKAPFYFPYGIQDFGKIDRDGMFYIDRTEHIRLLEEQEGQHFVFVRPRRFGKSVWLSTLEHYYDVARKDQFEQLFGDLAVGRDPTPSRNQYMILRWDFSQIDHSGSATDVRKRLHEHINSRIWDFSEYYEDFLPKPIEIYAENSMVSFARLQSVVRRTGLKLYVLIDEYDNFANEVMAQVGREGARYKELIEEEGMLKSVFKNLKGAVYLDRVFTTGVSPIVMADMTSGYNVGVDLHLEREFHDLCGFREEELEPVVAQLVAVHEGRSPSVAETMETMRCFYNGYVFHKKKPGRLYNPTMCLYFLKHFQKHGEFPESLLDANLNMDRQKLRFIGRYATGKQLLTSLSETGKVNVSRIFDRFRTEDMLRAGPKSDDFLASLLYYFGALTIESGDDLGTYILRVPNQVVRSLYLERLFDDLLPEQQRHTTAYQLAHPLYQYGDLAPVIEFIEETILPVFDNRDYRWANELTVKALFLTVLDRGEVYSMESEKELTRRYADLVLIRRADRRDAKVYDLLLEFKYVSLKDVNKSGQEIRELTRQELAELPAVKKAFQEAETSLRAYGAELAQQYDYLDLRSYTVIGVGVEKLVWREPSP